MDNQSVKNILQHINGLLANRQYDLLYKEDAVKRVTADEVENAINEYGGQVTLPPEEAYEKIFIYEHYDSEQEATVEMYLWINNEQSDLTLSCDVAIDGEHTLYAVNDVRVL